MRKYFIFLLLLPAILFLSACGGTLSIALETTPTPDQAPGATLEALEAQVATLQPQNTGLDMNASSDIIRQALLGSHTNWQTLWMDGEIVTTPSQGGSEKQRAQLWVDQGQARFRALSGPPEGRPRTLQVSDGTTQARTNLENGATQAQPLADSAHNLTWQAPPVSPAAAEIVSHPLDLEIDSPLSELAFPAVLGQQGGMFTPVSMEKISGRLALVVEHWFAAQLRARLWIDTETGALLRWDMFGKEDSSTSPATSIVIHNLAIDTPFPDELFDLQLKEKPQFALDASGAASPTPLPPAPEFGNGEGELYFVIDRAPEDLQLARLPGSCVDGSKPCPAPQVVEGFPNKNNTIEALVWSPDGRRAALVNQGLLHRYDPATAVWKELAQFPILREGVAWSANGEMLAFVGQQQDDRQDIYVVGPDGNGLENLTDGAFQGPGVSLWVEGFLADGQLLFEVMTAASAQPYTIQPRSGAQARPIQGLKLQHGILAIAPGGQQVAYTNTQDGTTTLHVTGLDLPRESVQLQGEAPHLATFQQASIQQILWSSVAENNEQWIAFLVSSGSGPDDTVNTVYAIRPDGTDLRQLYQNRSIHRLSFAGNGRFLIAALADTGQPVVIPVDGGQTRLLEAPGLRLDQRILGFSWRGQ